MGITVVEVVTTGPKGRDGTDIGMPLGGCTGQVLTKTSDADNDATWKAPLLTTGKPIVTGPVLPIVASGSVTLTITNYSSNNLYHVGVEYGSVTREGATVVWTPGFIPVSGTYYCNIFTIEAERVASLMTKHPVQLLKA